MITELKTKRNKDVGIDVDYVLQRLVDIGQMDEILKTEIHLALILWV